MAGTLSIVSSSITTQSGTKTIGPFTITSTSPIAAITELNFTTPGTGIGLQVPTGSSYCVIVPPTGYTGTISLCAYGTLTNAVVLGMNPVIIPVDGATQFEVSSSTIAVLECSFF